jgi:hypothetical protein
MGLLMSDITLIDPMANETMRLVAELSELAYPAESPHDPFDRADAYPED